MFLSIQTEGAKGSFNRLQRQTTYQDMSPHLARRTPFEAPHVECLRFFSLKIKKKRACSGGEVEGMFALTSRGQSKFSEH
jgi:hypothetical protein